LPRSGVELGRKGKTVNCRDTQQQFGDRLDGRLPAAQESLWETHVAGCAACRQEWAEYRAAWEALGQVPAIEPSVGFVERTLRRLEAAPASAPPRWAVVLRWAAVASMVVLTGWTSWLGYQRLHNERLARVYEAVRADVLDSEIIESLNQL